MKISRDFLQSEIRRMLRLHTNIHAASKDIADLVFENFQLKNNNGLINADDHKTVESAMKAICQHFGVTQGTIAGKNKDMRTAYIRMLTYYILYEHTRLNGVDIADMLNREHTTEHKGRENVRKALIHAEVNTRTIESVAVIRKDYADILKALMS